jgi:hypothetical protein
LTTLFGTPEVSSRRTLTLLPVLTVLFLISYGLMTLLIVEQGNTIQSQRTLIQQLLGDSTELSAMKTKAAIEHAQAPTAETQANPAKYSARHRNDPRSRLRILQIRAER